MKNRTTNRLFKALLYAVLALLCFLIETAKTVITFLPFFYCWSVPVVVMSFFTTDVIFYIWCAVYIVFCMLKAGVEVEEKTKSI